jgi:thymidylate kinase
MAHIQLDVTGIPGVGKTAIIQVMTEALIAKGIDVHFCDSPIDPSPSPFPSERIRTPEELDRVVQSIISTGTAVFVVERTTHPHGVK